MITVAAWIEIPLLGHAGGLGFILVIIEVAKEMPITLMTRSFGMGTLSIKIFEYTSEGQYDLAAIPSAPLSLVGALPIIVVNSQRRARSGG